MLDSSSLRSLGMTAPFPSLFCSSLFPFCPLFPALLGFRHLRFNR